jgi:hypothetical protein
MLDPINYFQYELTCEKLQASKKVGIIINKLKSNILDKDF